MKVADIERELDLARREGPVRDIVIPPCPELLTELQVETRKADPDPAQITRIAGSDSGVECRLSVSRVQLGQHVGWRDPGRKLGTRFAPGKFRRTGPGSLREGSRRTSSLRALNPGTENIQHSTLNTEG